MILSESPTGLIILVWIGLEFVCGLFSGMGAFGVKIYAWFRFKGGEQEKTLH